MISLLPTKFHEILFCSFRGVSLTNCVTDRRTDRTKTMSPHQSGGRHNYLLNIFFSVTTKFLADLVCPDWLIYVITSNRTFRISGKIFATVTGNKFFNIGLKLPCTYTFSGQAADVEKLRTLLKPTAT
jgi:hypothetical protein